MRSLDIAGTGMQAQRTNVEVISNNMANMTTTGFKCVGLSSRILSLKFPCGVGSDSSG